MIDSAISKLIKKFGSKDTDRSYRGFKARSKHNIRSAKNSVGEIGDDAAKLLRFKATKQEKAMLKDIEREMAKAHDNKRYTALGVHHKKRQIAEIDRLAKKRQKILMKIERRKNLVSGAGAASAGAAAYSMFDDKEG